MDDLHEKLSAPFPPGHLRWRMATRPKQVGGEWRVRLLAYIEKSHVERRLDEVFGPMGWKNSYRTEGLRCTCTIECGLIPVQPHEPVRWVTKEDGCDVTDFLNDANEMREKNKPPVDPVKAAYSDAFKRAGMKWGIGRYLNAMKFDDFVLQDGWSKTGGINVKAGETWMHVKPPTELPGFAMPKEAE